MNRNQRRMAAFNAKKADEQIGQQRFERKLTQAMTGCSDRVLNAVSAPSMRERQEEGAACLPDVAKYAAGYRKSKDIVTAR